MWRGTKVTVNLSTIDGRIKNLKKDRVFMTKIHEDLKRYCDPYVPKKSGTLRDSAEATPNGVVYHTDYAHYQYAGEVYGPNYPVYNRKLFMGWRSTAGVQKSPTGRELGVPGVWIDKYGNTIIFGHTTRGTGHHWAEMMLRDNGRTFKKVIRTRITKKLNGR